MEFLKKHYLKICAILLFFNLIQCANSCVKNMSLSEYENESNNKIECINNLKDSIKILNSDLKFLNESLNNLKFLNESLNKDKSDLKDLNNNLSKRNTNVTIKNEK